MDGFAFSTAIEGEDDEADSDVETEPDDGFGYTAAFTVGAEEQKGSVDAGQTAYAITIEYLLTGQGTTGDLSNDNPDGGEGPQFKGGSRFFPDAANYASRGDSRNIVRIRATLDKPKAGVPVYFRSFDVDDPSSNDTIDPKGGNGRDNRGTVAGANLDRPGDLATNGYRGQLRPVSGAFAAEGETIVVNTIVNAQNKAIAEVELVTSFNPGDNFRVVASLNKPKLQALNDTTSVPTEDAITGFTGAVTDQLSVWRHLHIEQDRMKAIPWGSKLTGNITATTEPDATTKESIVTTKQTIPAADVDKYVGATLYDNRGVPNVIMKVEPGDNARLTVYVHQFRPENGAFTILKGDAVEGRIIRAYPDNPVICHFGRHFGANGG